MKYFPLFVKFQDKRVIVSGGGETALAKLRLLLKTEAKIEVYSSKLALEIQDWIKQGRLSAISRELQLDDIQDAVAIYAANDDEALNTHVAELANRANVLVNVVDTPDQCDFITPAIVDRDPLVVAIGTEGAAPVLGRKLKSNLEAELPQNLGKLVKFGRSFRDKVAHLSSKKRRIFWSKYYELELTPENQTEATSQLEEILEVTLREETQGYISFVGAGPGDPDLLTLKARRKLHEADVVMYDRLVSPEVLELARREARMIEVGKTGYGQAWAQSDINALMIKYALDGDHVVRLKSGDPVIYGRLDEETDAAREFNIDFDVVPGISAANAAAASLKISLTKRGRNSELRILTGRDVAGFAEHDWRALAREGSCAAIYMGAKQATQLRGRLLMHGALASTPVIAIENVSRLNQRTIQGNLLTFPENLEKAIPQGPVVILYGIALEQAQSLELSKLAEIAQ